MAKKVLADKGYSTSEIREYLEERCAIICIPDKDNATVKHVFDRELYKKRNVVERFFQRIKAFRRIATCYDKLAVCFCGFISLASFIIKLRIRD